MFSGGILERIYNQISKADVIVADMTGRNPNVYYEVGYAHALGKLVILLTREADDIPFDLKHHQHIVYHGQVVNLKPLQTEKLRWAIKQVSTAETAPGSSFSVRVRNTTLIESAADHQIPLITIVVRKETCVLSFYVRNRLSVASPPVTHIYLFTSGRGNMIPCEPSSAIETAELEERIAAFGDGTELTKIKPFSLSQDEAVGGLIKQYRLEDSIPQLPPGAIERFSIVCKVRAMQAPEKLILRLHAGANTHDFPFSALTRLVKKKDKASSNSGS